MLFYQLIEKCNIDMVTAGVNGRAILLWQNRSHICHVFSVPKKDYTVIPQPHIWYLHPSHGQVSTVIQEASLYHKWFAPEYGYAGRIHTWGSFYANGLMVPIIFSQLILSWRPLGSIHPIKYETWYFMGQKLLESWYFTVFHQCHLMENVKITQHAWRVLKRWEINEGP